MDQQNTRFAALLQSVRQLSPEEQRALLEQLEDLHAIRSYGAAQAPQAGGELLTPDPTIAAIEAERQTPRKERIFTAVYKRDGDWWVGQLEELPSVVAQERTLEECRESLRGLVPIMLEVNRELRDKDYDGAPEVREELTVVV